MAVNIVLTVAGQGSGSGGESRSFEYSVVDPTAPLVTLSLSDTTGVTTYLWEILSQPVGASVSLSSDSVASPTFTPKNSTWGTYLIRCTVTRNGSQEIGTIGLSFKTPIRDMRFPAAGEKTEFSGSNGWMEAEQVLYEIVDGLSLTGYWDRTGTILSPSTAGDTLQLSEGTAAIPSVAYVNDADTGRFLAATGIEGFAVGGVAQLLFGNDGGPYIKAAEGHQYLKIGNYKTTSGNASQVLVEAVGAAANDGGTLELQATSTAGKTALSSLKSINAAGSASSYLEANSGTSASDTALAQIRAYGQGPTEVNVKADSTTNVVDSVINILATSALGNGTINIGVNAGVLGSVYLGDQYTNSIRIRDKNLEDSTSISNYLEVSNDPTEWENLYTNYGSDSLIKILNTLYGSSGGITIHNDLTGKQGGQLGEFYHLNEANYEALTTNLPFTNGSIPYTNAFEQLDEDSNFYWRPAGAASARFDLVGTSGAVFGQSVTAPDGIASYYLTADSTGTSGGSSLLSFRAEGNIYDCGYELGDSHKFKLQGEDVLTLDFITGIDEVILRVPDYSSGRYFYLFNDQTTEDSLMSLRAKTVGLAKDSTFGITATASSGGTGTIALIAEGGAGNITLSAAGTSEGTIYFDDQRMVGSTVVGPIGLCGAISEWNLWKTNCGGAEPSIIQSINLAFANGGGSAPDGQIVFGNSTGTGVTSESNFSWDADNDQLIIVNDHSETNWYDDYASSIHLSGSASQGQVIRSFNDLILGVTNGFATSDLDIIARTTNGTGIASVNISADGYQEYINLNATTQIELTTSDLDIDATVTDFNSNTLTRPNMTDIKSASYYRLSTNVTSTDAYTVNPDNGISQFITIDDDTTLNLTAPTGGSTRTTLTVNNSSSSSCDIDFYTIDGTGTVSFILHAVDTDITAIDDSGDPGSENVVITCAGNQWTIITLIYEYNDGTYDHWSVSAIPTFEVQVNAYIV